MHQQTPSAAQVNFPQKETLHISTADFLQLLCVVRRYHMMIWVAMTTTFLLSCIYLHFATYKYTASYTVSPAQETDDSIGKKLGSMSGLASLAGINLGDSNNTRFTLYVEALHSLHVADALISDPKIAQTIFADEWDSRTKSWRERQSTLSSALRTAGSVLGAPPRSWTPPTADRLKEYLKRQIIIVEDKQSPLVRVEYKHPDREFSIYLLTKINDSADALLRERMLSRTDSYIKYLNSKLLIVSNAEQRAAIAEALGGQERIRMVAMSDRPFAAELFERPSATQQFTSPRPLVVIVVGLLSGMLIGLTYIIVRHVRLL